MTVTFCPTLRLSASVPSARVKTLPSLSVISSAFGLTEVIVPLSVAARAVPEPAAIETPATTNGIKNLLTNASFGVDNDRRLARPRFVENGGFNSGQAMAGDNLCST